MGGTDSGRWEGHAKARVVEDCALTLDIAKIAAERMFRGGLTGTLDVARVGAYRASLGWQTYTGRDGGLVFRLSYAAVRGAQRETVLLPIHLATTRPHYGGVRWWWLCPGPPQVDPNADHAPPCRRRVAKLYLPKNEVRFACRACHRLSYRTSQEHRTFAELARRDPDAAAAVAMARLQGIAARLGA